MGISNAILLHSLLQDQWKEAFKKAQRKRGFNLNRTKRSKISPCETKRKS
jgi:hypothetical protein